MQRGELPEVDGVHVGPVLHQQLGHLVVAVGTGVVHWNQTTGGQEEGARKREMCDVSTELFQG